MKPEDERELDVKSKIGALIANMIISRLLAKLNIVHLISGQASEMHLHWERSHNTAGDCNIRSLSWMGRVPDEIPQVSKHFNSDFQVLLSCSLSSLTFKSYVLLSSLTLTSYFQVLP